MPDRMAKLLWAERGVNLVLGHIACPGVVVVGLDKHFVKGLAPAGITCAQSGGVEKSYFL